MSWKKSIFSYLMWFVYTSLVTAALVSLGSLYCQKNGIALYWGILFVVLYIGFIGGIVFLLRKLSSGDALFAGKGRGVLLMAEFAMVAVFLTLGLVFRVRGMEGIIQSSEYYETAKIVAGQGIPQIVHGAVYFYLQALRETFLLVGNRFIAGIWLQAVLQLLGALFLFFAVRKLAGRIAALTVLGFCMCAPFQVQEALVLSPEMPYFCLFAFSALLIAAGKQEGKKPVLLLLTSILAAVCCYIDVVGILLLFLVLLTAMKGGTGEADSGWKKSFLLGLAVLVLFILGFLLCAFSDVFFSGKSFEGVIGAWLRLYYPGSFQIPVTIGGAGYEIENLILFGIMVFGVFSFWCDRKRERISPCIIVAGLLVLGICYGILTEEMPGFHYLYLLLTLLAGIGLGQCFCPADAVETEKKEGEEGNTTDEIAKKDSEEEKPQEAIEVKTEEEKVPESEEQSKEKSESDSEEKTKEAVAPETEEQHKEEEKAGTEGKTKTAAEQSDELEREKALKEEFRQDAARRREKQELEEGKKQESEEGKKQIKYIENPLPLPKKHIKRVMKYSKQISEEDDFDHPVSENDDFDI